jgi:hypothetical protein
MIIWQLLADPAARYHDLGAGYYASRIDTGRKACSADGPAAQHARAYGAHAGRPRSLRVDQQGNSQARNAGPAGPNRSPRRSATWV